MATTATQTRSTVKLAEPSMYRVLYLNDDKTTMEFVVTTLIEFFDHSVDTAEQITARVHDEGQAVVAVLPYEVAEQKGIEVTLAARKAGFPLQIKVEPDTSI